VAAPAGSADAGRADASDQDAALASLSAATTVAFGRCAKVQTLRYQPGEGTKWNPLSGRITPDLAKFERDVLTEKIPEGGSVFFGRLGSDDRAADVTQAAGRLRVYPGGLFIAAGSPEHPVFIVLAGHEPARVGFEGAASGKFWVGKFTLRKLTKESSVPLTARVQLDSMPAPVTATLTLGSCTPDDAHLRRPEVNAVTEQVEWATLVRQDLALMPYTLTVRAPGYAPKSVELNPEQGRPLRPSLMLEREAPFTAEVVTGKFEQLLAGRSVVQQVRPSEVWSPLAGCPVPVNQDEGRYSFGPSVRGRLLGQASLGVYQSSVNRGQTAPLERLETGSVYLLECPNDEWVLARFTR
jgi:hypothetical protein